MRGVVAGSDICVDTCALTVAVRNVLMEQTPSPKSQGWAHRWTVVNGVRLHYVEAGAGPLVVLLHGFPEFWYAWHRQIGPLADAGFRVLAPDLRGYNLSDKPRGAAAYRPEL